jgi:3-methyladenine DNA glycosylase AlkD
MDEKRGKPYIRLLRQEGGIEVWLVDGAHVRRKLDIDFTNFGHHFNFPCIPLGEFWLDREYSEPSEEDFFIRNLIVDYRLSAKGASRRRALAAADAAERAMRLKSCRAWRRCHKVESPQARLKRVHKRLLASYGRKLKVWLVDGLLVRTWFYIRFSHGGHEFVYKFVPPGEVWIDDDLLPSERAPVLLHELHERQLMASGMSYDAAHDLALEVERECRRRPSRLSGRLLEALKRNAGLPDRPNAEERAKAVIFELKPMGDPARLKGMAKVGIDTRRALGVGLPELRHFSAFIGTDRRLAHQLWKSGYREARILAAMIDDPKEVGRDQMDRWAADFTDWEVCDQANMSLFWRASGAWAAAARWLKDDREFVRRSGLAILAVLARRDAESPDSRFLRLLPAVEKAAADRRRGVRPAVSWALRQVGARDGRLRREVKAAAKRLLKSPAPSARATAREVLAKLK